MNKYKKYTIFGVAVNLIFYLLGNAPQVRAVSCNDDIQCSTGYHTNYDRYLESTDGSRKGVRKVYISPNFRDNSQSIIKSAYQEWDCLGNDMSLVNTAKKKNAQISFVPKTLDANIYGVTMYKIYSDGKLINTLANVIKNHIYARVQLDENKCNLKNALFKVAVHECGHALGLTHVTCRESVMYPYWDNSLATSKPTSVDLNTLTHIYK